MIDVFGVLLYAHRAVIRLIGKAHYKCPLLLVVVVVVVVTQCLKWIETMEYFETESFTRWLLVYMLKKPFNFLMDLFILFIYLGIDLLINLCVYLFMYLFIYLCIYLCIYLFYLCIYVFIYLCMYLGIYLGMY